MVWMLRRSEFRVKAPLSKLLETRKLDMALDWPAASVQTKGRWSIYCSRATKYLDRNASKVQDTRTKTKTMVLERPFLKHNRTAGTSLECD
jgi:hypothetical protein